MINDHLQSEKIRLIMTLRRNGIKSTTVLGAIESVPRELFVDRTFIDQAYADQPLPIAQNQTISQPTIVAMMTEALEVTDRHVVLEIGTGSGYQAAILSKLARRIHTIERHKELHQISLKRFEQMGLRNITAHLGDGSKGWSHAAPYDRIITTAAAADLPHTLLEQLADGGIMIIPIGKEGAEQVLYKITKLNGTYTKTALSAVRFVPLVEETSIKS